MIDDRIRYGLKHGIYGLFQYWAIGVGSLIVMGVLPLILPPFWTPFIGIISALILLRMRRANDDSRFPLCGRIIYICNLSLVWSSLIMIAMYILIHHTSLIQTMWLLDLPINSAIPFIPILIIAPVTALVSAWLIRRGHAHHVCQNCQIKHGDRNERGFIGRLFDQEGNYQLWLLFATSIMLSIGEWIYYFAFFVNVNFNTPDTFYFVWCPTILYCLTLIFLGIRYSGLLVYYNRVIEGGPLNHGSFSQIRFLIISGDEIFLTTNTDDSSSIMLEDDKIDTPAILTIDHRNNIPDWDADTFFKGLTGIAPDALRYLYRTNTEESGCNIFHYAALINDPKVIDRARVNGQWLTVNALQLHINRGAVAPLLASEVYRIYNITMAWKSYDRRGFRLYDIKNYKPTFRLRDLANRNVDYNDSNWLFVAANNEDRPFFKIRRLWRKLFNGISE